MAPGPTDDLGTAFAALRGGLRHYLRKRVSDPAVVEDLVQDVFVKASAAIAANRAPRNLTGWLYAAARTTVADYYRAARPAAIALDDALPDPRPADDERSHQELATCLRPMISNSPRSTATP